MYMTILDFSFASTSTFAAVGAPPSLTLTLPPTSGSAASSTTTSPQSSGRPGECAGWRWERASLYLHSLCKAGKVYPSHLVMGTSPKITNRIKSNRPGYESNRIESVIESNCPSIMQVNPIPKGFLIFPFSFYLLFADNPESLLLFS